MIQNDAAPARTVIKPSITAETCETSHSRNSLDVLKIHAQAGFPPTPSMLEIAAYDEGLPLFSGHELSHTASKPPKAPETVAAEKKIAARIPNSERLYQLRSDQWLV